MDQAAIAQVLENAAAETAMRARGNSLPNLTPAEMQVALENKHNAEVAASLAKLRPASEAKTANEARALLNERSGNKAWADKLLAGNVEIVREFNSLSELAALGGDRFEAVMNGTAEASPFETVTGGELSTHNMQQLVGFLRDAGLSDGTIREAHEATPVTAEYKAEAKRFGDQLKSNPDWCKRLLAGDKEAQRQLLALNVIKLAPVAA